MRVSLIVTTYNWPDALSLVLSSVAHQEVLPDEVVIADDGSDKNTKKIVTNFLHNFNIPVSFMAKGQWVPCGKIQK